MITWLKENNYLNKQIEIDNNDYDTYYKKKTNATEKAPRIIIVSYQPNETASELLRLCIKSIKKFTETDYELWVVDNNSPEDKIKWLDKIDDINVVYIRTEPQGEASFANGLALETAIKLIDSKTQFLVTLHEDTVVCRYGWLEYLLSKLDNKTKAAGFRLTKARVPEGVLHVCGYMIDFQTFKKLSLNFLPQLPEFDIGDKVIYDLKNKDFTIFTTPNTFDDESLVTLIPKTLGIHNLNVTRAFNDKNEIIYMHLGRGIPKAKGEYKNKEKSSSEQWIDYIKRYLFSEPVLQQIDLKKVNDFDFSKNSIKDFYKVAFYEDILNKLPPDFKNAFFGNRNKYFNKYNLNDLNNQDLRYKEDVFNCIVFDKILDNTLKIRELIDQCYRALVKGGIMALSIQSDKSERDINLDGIKYLWKIMFREVSVQKQGSDAVLKLVFDTEKIISKTPGNLKDDLMINKFIKRRLVKIIKKDNKSGVRNLFSSGNIATGYSVTAIK